MLIKCKRCGFLSKDMRELIHHSVCCKEQKDVMDKIWEKKEQNWDIQAHSKEFGMKYETK